MEVYYKANNFVTKFASVREFQEEVMRNRSLSDMEKLRLVFNASKEDLKERDPPVVLRNSWGS